MGKTEKIAVILENQNLQQKVTEIERNLVDSTNDNAELKGKLSEMEEKTSYKTSEINEKLEKLEIDLKNRENENASLGSQNKVLLDSQALLESKINDLETKFDQKCKDFRT